MSPAPPTVLIVEDTPDIGTMLVTALHHYGAASTLVSTGMAALQALTQSTYTILLTDYQLPDMTGTQLITQAQSTDPPPCIILMSGHSQSSLADQLLGIALGAYLAKPFTVPDLYAALDRCRP